MKQDLPVNLNGVVRHYKGNGRKLGYPTANIDTSTDLDDGVYFGFADLAVYKHQPTLIFVGTPTTVGDTERRIEAHLLDIDDVDYYGQPLALDIRQFHRSNKKFDSIDNLIGTMKQDETAARQWFAKNARSSS